MLDFFKILLHITYVHLTELNTLFKIIYLRPRFIRLVFQVLYVLLQKGKRFFERCYWLCKLSRRTSILSSFCNLFKIMSTFFPRLSTIDSAVITSSSASLVLVERLASLLFYLSGEKTSEEEDLGRSFLFGGIELQRITRQKAEHRRIRPYTLTVPSIPLLLLCRSRWCHCWHCLNSLMA